MQLTISSIAAFEPLPEHDKLHTGPYGVEAPPHWDFVVTVTEITTSVKMHSENESSQKLGQSVDVSGEAGNKTKKS